MCVDKVYNHYTVTIDTPLCLIIEFAAHGSLKHFLTLCKQNMEKLSKAQPESKEAGYYNESKVMLPVTQTATQPVTGSATQPMTQSSAKPVGHYVNTDDNWYMYQKQPTDGNTPLDYYNISGRRLQCLPRKDYTDTPGRLGVVDIYYFLLQIAKGMDHIGKMKVSGSNYTDLHFALHSSISLLPMKSILSKLHWFKF